MNLVPNVSFYKIRQPFAHIATLKVNIYPFIDGETICLFGCL